MVRPTRDPRKFEVRSRSRPTQWHAVDLTAYRGNGDCECEDFGYRFKPELQRGHLPGDDMRCDHIREAREALLEEVIQRLATLPRP